MSGCPDSMWVPLSAPWGLSAASHRDHGTSEVLQLPGNLLQTSVRPVLQGKGTLIQWIFRNQFGSVWTLLLKIGALSKLVLTANIEIPFFLFSILVVMIISGLFIVGLKIHCWYYTFLLWPLVFFDIASHSCYFKGLCEEREGLLQDWLDHEPRYRLL